MTVHFVKPELEDELLDADWRLRELVLPKTVNLCGDAGYHLYVTSIYRENSSIHKAWRAIDTDLVEIDGEAQEWPYNIAGIKIMNETNRLFQYGGARYEVAYWHNALKGPQVNSRAGWHLHLQAPPGDLTIP